VRFFARFLPLFLALFLPLRFAMVLHAYSWSSLRMPDS
jgi:hypothetical protein